MSDLNSHVYLTLEVTDMTKCTANVMHICMHRGARGEKQLLQSYLILFNQDVYVRERAEVKPELLVSLPN